MKDWSANDTDGILLVLEPTEKLNESRLASLKQDKGIKIIIHYLFRYKKWMIQAFIALLIGSLLQLAFPFLTQRIVDKGIKNKDLHFIYLILLAQLALFAGRTIAEVIRSFILLKLSSFININLVSDFFKKLMSLPLGFFDSKMTGDILQRINDHQRIEIFLTSGALNVSFSVINILVFSGVLAHYDWWIFAVFLTGSILYFSWFWYFMKKRAVLDYKRFSQLSENQEKNLELIYGMQEIKLHNAEDKKRVQWELLQLKLFKINQKGFSLRQKQNVGSSLINELKNILITFLSASLVIHGTLSLGEMLAISYITGQLNYPVTQLLEFLQSYQDASLSAARINEIHRKKGEVVPVAAFTMEKSMEDIEIRDLSFRYHGSSQLPFVLNHINFCIPKNKVTAIVGASGSGKTTLMKLLLKFYEPTEGQILFGNTPLEKIPHHWWRNYCGAVLQEGYLFSDTIAGNICLNESGINESLIQQALKSANVEEFVHFLPMGINTKIGQNGLGLSTGQKQRILIARAIYKNPSFLLFDEATSSLDAGNEKIIMSNLEKIFNNKTVLIIAHRLSTVKNADTIIVLDKGEIKETGTHDDLVRKKGIYFELIRNQLELGE